MSNRYYVELFSNFSNSMIFSGESNSHGVVSILTMMISQDTNARLEFLNELERDGKAKVEGDNPSIFPYTLNVQKL